MQFAQDINDLLLEKEIRSQAGMTAVLFFHTSDRYKTVTNHFFRLVASKCWQVATFCRLNTDENPTFSLKRGISITPSVALFRDDQEVLRLEGFENAADCVRLWMNTLRLTATTSSG